MKIKNVAVLTAFTLLIFNQTLWADVSTPINFTLQNKSDKQITIEAALPTCVVWENSTNPFKNQKVSIAAGKGYGPNIVSKDKSLVCENKVAEIVFLVSYVNALSKQDEIGKFTLEFDSSGSKLVTPGSYISSSLQGNDINVLQPVVLK